MNEAGGAASRLDNRIALCGISVATQLPHTPRLKLLRFSERWLSWCITASVHRKSAARQVESKSNAGCRGFSITRYEGSRWCLRRTRSGYGESTGMRAEVVA